jgi:hypothetical protein
MDSHIFLYDIVLVHGNTIKDVVSAMVAPFPLNVIKNSNIEQLEFMCTLQREA